MKSFRDFIESEVPINKTRQIRKNWGKKYLPGNFGVEIEFKAGTDTEIETYFDEFEARKAFKKEVGQPEDPEDWKEENKEPEEPKKEDYEYNETDFFVNYWNLNMEKKPIKEPETLANYSSVQIEKLFNDFPERFVSFLKITIDDVMYRLKSLYKGHGDIRYGFDIFKSKKDMDDFMIRAEIQTNITTENLERQLDIRYNIQKRFSLEQVDYLHKLQYFAHKALADFYKFHKERAQAITEDIYSKEIEEIWEYDMEEWKEEHEQWLDEYREIKKNWTYWDEDEEFEKWLDERYSRNRLITNRERFETEHEITSSNIEHEIEEVGYWMRKNGFGDWQVHRDEPGVIEVASPILNSSDFGSLKKIIEYLDKNIFTSETGLHVHIGMPEITNSFDLVAFAAIIDEKAILAMAGRTEYSIERYTKKKKDLFDKLWINLPEGELTDSQFRIYMNLYIDRYYGVNTIKAFNKYGTVELRYLSSQLIDVGIEKVFNFINYFLMLPRIAMGRNQIKYYIPQKGTIVFTRLMGGKIEVKKFSEGINPKVPMPNRPVADLRQQIKN